MSNPTLDKSLHSSCEALRPDLVLSEALILERRCRAVCEGVGNAAIPWTSWSILSVFLKGHSEKYREIKMSFWFYLHVVGLLLARKFNFLGRFFFFIERKSIKRTWQIRQGNNNLYSIQAVFPSWNTIISLLSMGKIYIISSICYILIKISPFFPSVLDMSYTWGLLLLKISTFVFKYVSLSFTWSVLRKMFFKKGIMSYFGITSLTIWETLTLN